MTPKIISELAKRGLHFTVDEHGISIDGLSELNEDRRQEAINYFEKNKQAFLVLMQAVDIFKIDIPGYCPNCPAAVWNWPRIHAKKVHRRWCLYKSYFEGKAAKPVQLIDSSTVMPAIINARGQSSGRCQLEKIQVRFSPSTSSISVLGCRSDCHLHYARRLPRLEGSTKERPK